MYEELFSMLKRPALWQRSAAPFWDDEHISKGMLAAHLDPAGGAASRRLAEVEASVNWLASVIPAGGRLLDLGCGPGLYTKRLAARGYRTTGIDLSRRSIAYAKEHDGATRYICQSYLELEAQGEYDAATLIFCDYAALTAPERALLVQKAYRALAPGGLFILDVFTEARAAGLCEACSWSLNEGGGFWSPLPHLYLKAVRLYENGLVSAEQHAVLTAGGAVDYIVWNSFFSRERLMAELAPAGFINQGVFADACGAPYSKESETLCLIAQKPL